MTTIQVSGPTELTAALKTTQAGTVLQLAAGAYGMLNLSGKSGLTFAAADPAARPQFTSIKLTKCVKMMLDGLAVSRPPQIGDTDKTVRAIDLTSCDGIDITNSKVEVQKATQGAYAGFPNGFGIHVNLSKNVRIAANEIVGGHAGVMMTYADTVLVSGNDVHEFRAVGVRSGGSNRIIVRGNDIHDAHPWHWGLPGGDHGDFIHVWDRKGAPPIQGIVIEDNTLMQGAGWAILGITVQATQKSGIEDARVANNLIITNHNQAILFSGIKHIEVEHNTLMATIKEFSTPTAIGGQARFQIGGAASGMVTGNIWGGISSPLPACAVANNLTMKFAQQAGILANPQGRMRSDFVARTDGPGAGLGIH